jgi:hypothetical protein
LLSDDQLERFEGFEGDASGVVTAQTTSRRHLNSLFQSLVYRAFQGNL